MGLMEGEQEYPSVLLGGAVEAFGQLPGVGRKTALRYALHLLTQLPEQQRHFLSQLEAFVTHSGRCPRCNSLSDGGALCSICQTSSRNAALLCVVGDYRDILALERTQEYHGYYFSLGGLIDPLHGVGPSQLPLGKLEQRVSEEEVEEVILAFAATPEGDTTSYYIARLVGQYGVKVSQLARGVYLGATLEQIDSPTLGTALAERRVLTQAHHVGRAVAAHTNREEL